MPGDRIFKVTFQKLICPPENGQFYKEMSSSNHNFSGDMKIFRGVSANSFSPLQSEKKVQDEFWKVLELSLETYGSLKDQPTEWHFWTFALSPVIR